MGIYRVTESAGAYVSGRPSPGAGEIVILTDRQAAYELRVGSIVPEAVSEIVDAGPARPKKSAATDAPEA